MEDETTAETVKIRPMAIVPGANPFEMFLLVACVLLSITHLVGFTPPTSIAEFLPSWAITLWYSNLGLGSAIGIYGGLRARMVFIGKPESSLRSGLVQYALGWSYVGTASLTYGLAVMLLSPEQGIVAGAMTVSWGIASHVRAYQVRRLLRMRGGGQHRNA
jgi:hypothetical protein